MQKKDDKSNYNAGISALKINYRAFISFMAAPRSLKRMR
jgi:hypothetical protein